jgi:beta-lactamase superfamily II metal-dependent hydrolase
VKGTLIAIVAIPTIALACALVAAAATLDFYFIDVEGGQSTLIVTPSKQSLLVDTGYAGFGDRDANRIMAAVRVSRSIAGFFYCVVERQRRCRFC